jgi:hypothetical protein
VHVEVRRAAANRRQLTEDVDVGGAQPDLLLRLAERRREQRVVLLVVPPAGEGELAAVVAVVGPDDQDEPQLAAGIPEDRGQNGR